MKKIITILVALGALTYMTWYIIKLMNEDGKSDTELIEFAIKEVDRVDKVIISDPFGATFEIIKNGDIWTDKDGGCITQESATFVLEAFKRIQFKGYLPDNSIKKFNTLMASQHTKVEIFQDGEWTKTWYIGPTSQDHYGQIMLLDSKEFGKSTKPVIMRIEGLNGIIEPRFFADPRKWRCTNIFKIPIENLSKVDLKFNDEPERSFTVIKKKYDLRVLQQGKLLHGVDTAMIFRYLNNYQKIHYDIPNYELNNKQIDSLKSTRPFAVLSVFEKSGKKTRLKCYRIKAKEYTLEGKIVYKDNDKERFWCELPNGDIVKCQYFVFNPLFLGHIYFPMDVSMLNPEAGVAVE